MAVYTGPLLSSLPSDMQWGIHDQMDLQFEAKPGLIRHVKGFAKSTTLAQHGGHPKDNRLYKYGHVKCLSF